MEDELHYDDMSVRQQKVYKALHAMQDKDLTPSQVVDLCDLPEEDVLDVLETFEDEGLIEAEY